MEAVNCFEFEIQQTKKTKQKRDKVLNFADSTQDSGADAARRLVSIWWCDNVRRRLWEIFHRRTGMNHVLPVKSNVTL